MAIINVILTSLLSIIALFIVTKLMGHKQVAQLDFFDYVCGITIGSIGAELATELENPEKPLIAIGIYGLVSVLLTFVTSKIPKARKYINGSPTILMHNGKLYRKNLEKSKLDLSEFMLICREAGYFDLDEIQTAVFEHNGKISILPKASYRPATPSDLKIPVKATHIGVEVIIDGCVMGENLMRIDRDIDWLNTKLNLFGVNKTKDVFLAVYHPEDDKLTLYQSNE